MQEFEAYLHDLQYIKKFSAHTLASYQRQLFILKKILGEKNFDALQAADVRYFIAKAHAAGESAATIAHRLSVWRAFYRWLGQRKIVSVNPIAGIRAPKKAKLLPKALSVDDTQRLMETVLPQTKTALRDHAILELFYSSGLRLSELIGLDMYCVEAKDYQSQGWIDWQESEVTVLGKGRKMRKVPVGQQAMQALAKWRIQREGFIKDDTKPLFLSIRGKRMACSVVRKMIQKVALQAGIPAHVHPHVLRHSFATHILQSSGDLRAVQELLGHKSIVATQVYTSLDFQYLARIYDKVHPRAKKRRKS